MSEIRWQSLSPCLQSGRLPLAQVELRLVAARLDRRYRLQRVRQPLLQGRRVAARLRHRRNIVVLSAKVKCENECEGM